MVRTNQGGSILSFLVVGGVLAILLIGAAYFLRHNLAPGSRRPDVAVTNDREQTSRQDSDDTKSEQPKKDSSSGETNKNENKPTGDSADKKDETSPTTQVPSSPAPEAGPSTADLPATGPSDMLFAGLMFSVLVALLAAYGQSRRLPASL